MDSAFPPDTGSLRLRLVNPKKDAVTPFRNTEKTCNAILNNKQLIFRKIYHCYTAL